MDDGAGHVENSYRQGRLIILKLDEAEHITARLLSEGGLQKHLSKFKICGSIRRRKQEVNDLLLKGRNLEGIKDHLTYEWEHFHIQQSRDFLENIGALTVDTSGYFHGALPDVKALLTAYLF